MGKNKKIKLYVKKSSSINNYKWLLIIIFWTLIISFSINLITETIIPNVNIYTAILILVLIIATGVFFDILGVAVTAADETPFHSLASRKVKGAKTAVALIRSADRVSNFCNDVIGDIAGIISGGTGAVIIAKLIINGFMLNKTIIAISFSSIIAAITIGGKALGKNFAISQANNIVFRIAYLIETLSNIKNIIQKR
ncbi:hypothetical protein ABG79_01316 [Caloramator mitchellensis]|uniref:CNNM transmembrane domain-containing protein n=1 Tax=Caloramator mitchellensis TaxID=908809 RepID=A0A0R3JTH9_CALMK|nr:hypothetical protein [Caloramator mitchellensis]KRQ86825.1 hypothetical protein ABG79_01316 [Caloramator mitchellensis]